jgi:hypothetical protein
VWLDESDQTVKGSFHAYAPQYTTQGRVESAIADPEDIDEGLESRVEVSSCHRGSGTQATNVKVHHMKKTRNGGVVVEE